MITRKVRAEAVELAAILASHWYWSTYDLRDHFVRPTRSLVGEAWLRARHNRGLTNRERYAEAECLLREGWTP